MMHPDTELRPVAESIGLGVFAKKDIPKGTIVYTMDPLEVVISYKRKQSLPEAVNKILDKYSYIDARKRYILSWDQAKFVNHSCEPNTITSGYGFEIAIRDIAAGEQITDDYGLLNIEHPMKCHCGSSVCRNWVNIEDSFGMANVWDQQIKNALSCFQSVDQPLIKLFPDCVPLSLMAYLTKKSRYKSVRTVLVKPQKKYDLSPHVLDGAG
jgi:hypothetical protein